MRRSMIFVMAAAVAASGGTLYLGSSAGVASAAAACAPAWSATAVYVKDNVASQNGHNYTAKWWTQNEAPATHSAQWDVWADNGVCGGTTTPTTPPATTTPPTTPPATPPATTTPPTTQPPTTGIPKRALIGYLHASFANGSGYLRMADVPSNWDIINLAFGEPTSATSGDIRFTLCPATECPGVESEADFIAAIRNKRAAGKKVLLSIGGANGQVQLTTTAARDKFVSSVSAIIDRYGLDGVDVDFEGHSLSLNTGDTDFKNPTTPVIVNLISALKSLKARYGANFVLTMAPETFFVQLGYQYYGSGPWGGQDPRAGSYLPVIYALRNDLTVLHVQDYNSGSIMGLDNQYHSMGGADFHIAMTDMLLAGFPVAGNAANAFPALREDQVGFGAPASVNAGNGYVAPAAVQQAVGCLVKGTNCGSYTPRSGTNPNLRGLMTWSINWDKFAGWEFQNQNGAYFKNQ
ncbi:glycosyl hydrolase family 18 protein [Actinoplanes sp. NPDC048796]|uniref:glycosyl hydrolase family 18 protein n=1 Tax=Actinoplanes sp. NPDC048796 TaxID=3155640 RepID=UPI0033CDED07